MLFRSDGRVYLASALIDGHACLRVCFVNFRTRREDVAFLLDTVRELGEQLSARPASDSSGGV